MKKQRRRETRSTAMEPSLHNHSGHERRSGGSMESHAWWLWPRQGRLEDGVSGITRRTWWSAAKPYRTVGRTPDAIIQGKAISSTSAYVTPRNRTVLGQVMDTGGPFRLAPVWLPPSWVGGAAQAGARKQEWCMLSDLSWTMKIRTPTYPFVI